MPVALSVVAHDGAQSRPSNQSFARVWVSNRYEPAARASYTPDSLADHGPDVPAGLDDQLNCRFGTTLPLTTGPVDPDAGAPLKPAFAQ